MTLSLRTAGLAIVATLLPLAPPAHAEHADRDKPLVLEAGNASYDDLKQVCYLTGNVALTKGITVLRSDQADLCADLEDYDYATTTFKPGNLVLARQKRNNVDEYIQGWGEHIEYDSKQEISKLTTRARMERLQGAAQLDEIRGAVTTYGGQKESYTASSGAEDATATSPLGRVCAVLTSRTSAPAVSVSAPATKP